MFKILGRNLKKSFGLFIVFFTISLVFSVLCMSVESRREDNIAYHEVFSDKFINLSFQTNSNITNKEFLKALDEEKGAIISKPIEIEKNGITKFSGHALYFNKECANLPPMYQGKFLKIEDFSKDLPIAVVGKELLSELEIKGNKRYLTYGNQDYEVVGIMGYKNKNSYYDDKFMINLNSNINDMESFKKDMGTVMWKFDNVNIAPHDSINNIYKKLSELDKNFKINIEDFSGHYNPLRTSLEIYKSGIIIFIIFIIVLFLNIINISSFWIIDMKKEIGIRKALGGTNRRIIFKIIGQYQLIALSASSIALLVTLILLNFPDAIAFITGFYSENNYINPLSIISVLMFALLLGLIVALIPLKQIIKMQSNEIIRGR